VLFPKITAGPIPTYQAKPFAPGIALLY
jgi:hypothetical protein